MQVASASFDKPPSSGAALPLQGDLKPPFIIYLTKLPTENGEVHRTKHLHFIIYIILY